MNGLSWLLYGSQVAGNVGTAAGIICLFGGMAAVGAGIFWAAGTSSDMPEIAQTAGKVLKTMGAVFAISAVVAVLTPSKNTIMLIAASEVGETVLASKDVQAIGGEAGALASDSLKLLRKYVTDQLNAETAE